MSAGHVVLVSCLCLVGLVFVAAAFGVWVGSALAHGNGDTTEEELGRAALGGFGLLAIAALAFLAAWAVLP